MTDDPDGQKGADSPVLNFGLMSLWKETWDLDADSALFRHYMAFPQCFLRLLAFGYEQIDQDGHGPKGEQRHRPVEQRDENVSRRLDGYGDQGEHR